MITIRRFTICMAILLITAIGCMYWIYHSRQYEINHLKTEKNILWAYRLNEPALKEQIATLKADKKKLQQQLDNLNIHYEADEKYIDYVNYQHLKAMSWINIAELIFENNNITYSPYLGDRELRIEQ